MALTRTQTFLETLVRARTRRQKEQTAAYKDQLASELEEATTTMRRTVEAVLALEVRTAMRAQLVYQATKEEEWLPGQPALSNTSWLLVSRERPSGAEDVALGCDAGWTPQVQGKPYLRLWPTNLSRPTGASYGWAVAIYQSDTVQEQQAKLAEALLPAIERAVAQQQRQLVKEQAEKERLQEYHEERRRWAVTEANREAARLRLRENMEAQVSQTRARLEKERTEFAAIHSWPKGSRVTVYLLDWIAAYDHQSGSFHRERVYVTSLQPNDGWLQRLLPQGLVPFRLNAPNGCTATVEEWDSPEDLPQCPAYLWSKHFSEKVEVSEAFTDGYGQEQAVEEYERVSLEPLQFPSPGLAQLLQIRQLEEVCV